VFELVVLVNLKPEKMENAGTLTLVERFGIIEWGA
jgi:hypothetical protein